VGVRDPPRDRVDAGGAEATGAPQWLLYADPEVARLRRSWSGSITPIIDWLHYADPGMALLGRSVTVIKAMIEGIIVKHETKRLVGRMSG
jgi:hypothetical protein